MGKRRQQDSPRITLPTAAVLRKMLEDPTGTYYGLALAEAVNFPSGTIYPILARLEAAGWVHSSWENADPVIEQRPRRRLYKLTGSGAQAARQTLQHVNSLVSLPTLKPVPDTTVAGNAQA